MTKSNKDSLLIPGFNSPILAPSAPSPADSSEQMTEGQKAGVSNTPLNLTALERTLCKVFKDRCAPWIDKTDETRAGIEVHLDWLTFYSPAKGVSKAVLEELNTIIEYLGDKDCGQQSGLKIRTYNGEPDPYTDRVVNKFGGQLSWCKLEVSSAKRTVRNEVSPRGFQSKYLAHEDKYKVRFVLPGKQLSARVGTESECRLVSKLIELGLVPTRIDVAADCYGREIKLLTAIEAVRKGYFSGVRKYRIIESGNIDDGCTGLTLELGSRRSNSFCRIYDTHAKHGFDATRIELELKGKKARLFVENLLSWYNTCKRNPETIDWKDTIPQYYFDTIVSNIDFIDRSKKRVNGSIDWCPQLDWWSKFCSLKAFNERLTVKTKKPSLEATGNWLRKQVVTTLRMVSIGLGFDGFVNFLLNEFDKVDELNRLKLSSNDYRQAAIKALRTDGVTALGLC